MLLATLIAIITWTPEPEARRPDPEARTAGAPCGLPPGPGRPGAIIPGMSLLRQAPQFTAAAAAALVRERYGIDAAASPLPSERDQNFRVRARDGAEFVLKIANAAEDLELLRAQNAAMDHAASAAALCPRVVAGVDGETIASAGAPNGAIHFVRLVTWLPGVPLGVSPDRSPDLLEDIGRRVGEIDRALVSFDHPAIHRDFYWDLASAPAIIRDRAPLVSDVALRRIVDEAADRFARDTAPLVPSLRTSAIHNDANEHNVLVCDGRVSGIIDFGDIVHGWTAGDLAIAIAYAVLDTPDPIASAAAVARGYESRYPLIDAERTALMGLVRLRLAASVCIAAAQQRERPGDEYLTVSQEPIRRTLPKLLDAG